MQLRVCAIMIRIDHNAASSVLCHIYLFVPYLHLCHIVCYVMSVLCHIVCYVMSVLCHIYLFVPHLHLCHLVCYVMCYVIQYIM